MILLNDTHQTGGLTAYTPHFMIMPIISWSLPEFLLSLRVELITNTPNMTSCILGVLELIQPRLKKFREP